MGDVAGVLEIIVLFFSFFTYAFVEQSYFLKLIGKIHMAKTDDKSIMNFKSLKNHTVDNDI